MTRVNTVSSRHGEVASIQFFSGSNMNSKFESVSKRLLGAMTFSALGLASTAHAFAPMSTDDTGTQGRGGNQIELGYVFERNTNLDTELDDRIDISETSSSIPLTYTYGLTDRVDASLSIARQITQVKGWQNSELGLKWNFYGDQSKGWSAAIKPTLMIPVSKNMQSDGLGSARVNWGVALIGSYMAEDYEFHTNLKYNSNYLANIPDMDNERSHLWTFSVAPVWNVNDQWKVGLDLGVQTNPGYDSRSEAFTQLAVSYAPIENLQIGLGVGYAQAMGSDNKARGLSITTTASYQF